jgi:hypothetical protein
VASNHFGLIQNFVKVMGQNGVGFVYFKNKFHLISDANIKEGAFLGP